ncbi:hypothetical protein RFI_24847 [Reticulomyxa filosa]|uniref:Uncharacterized protein n=1 Tax=Reticulomyxa filosa TaxID=46433 RepID=X6MES4_RETFI|nr:hypothetical protein RFI_24847 [Reticulomyxa filosa]|eukprot:ETO12528.1 hypothetical protein RFI_24847 [Reticulomyxa filosa]
MADMENEFRSLVSKLEEKHAKKKKCGHVQEWYISICAYVTEQEVAELKNEITQLRIKVGDVPKDSVFPKKKNKKRVTCQKRWGEEFLKNFSVSCVATTIPFKKKNNNNNNNC